jgi:hypothetical protein
MIDAANMATALQLEETLEAIVDPIKNNTSKASCCILSA